MSDYILIFTIGFLGSIHCVGMCGSICLAFLNNDKGKATYSAYLAYNSGRIFIYTVLGGLLGLFGNFIKSVVLFQNTFSIIAGILMMLIGIIFLKIIPGKDIIEVSAIYGKGFFAKVLNRLSSLNACQRAFPLGIMTGFLPCGLLYAVGLKAVAAGSLFSGAITMAVFGLGTLPAMLLSTVIARSILKDRMLGQRLAYVFIIVVGIITILRGGNIFEHISMHGHSH
ncbi:MAG: sulfite exporter TauE/SafE family protein [Deltaproteobacteria bacterium]|nr:sulfite exporter TauE/SafE family protein [Deltaproteobacteria bacterium]